MKAEGTIVIISLLGTISQAAKLLKVPRIYNAVITSDKELLPSQAFPALSPVLQGIHFPHFANTLYQPIGVQSIPVMNRNSDPSVGTEPRSFERPKNQIPYETYAKDTPSIPIKNDDLPTNRNLPKSTPILFIPNFELKNNNEENMPNIIPNSNFKSDTVNTKKPFYPHYDEEIGQIFNVVNYDNKKVYSASSPTSQSQDSNSQTTQKISVDGGRGPSFLFPQGNPPPPSRSSNNQFLNTQSANNNQFSSDQDEPSDADDSPQLNVNQYPFFGDFVKNNAPKDKTIADVPPPPLPVGNPSSRRKNENPPVNPLQLGIGF